MNFLSLSLFSEGQSLGKVEYSALLKLEDYEDQLLEDTNLNAGQHKKLVVVMKKK